MTEFLDKDTENRALQQESELNSRRVFKWIGISGNANIEDFALSTETIVCADQKNPEYEPTEAYADFERNDSYVCASELRDMYVKKVGVGKKVRILSLAGTLLCDRAFKEVTDILIRDVVFVENSGILDLSFNALTADSAPQIIRWIEKGAVFINLYGNAPCSMKNIGELCKCIRKLKNGNMDEVKCVMRHIVFLPKYYIYHAKIKVKLFRQLCELGYLSDDWADIQKEYYFTLSGKQFPEILLNFDPDENICFEE